MKRVLRTVILFVCTILPALAFAEDVQSLMEKGIRAYSAGRKQAALEFFKQAEAVDPRDADVLSNLAKLTEAMQRWDEASIYWTAYINQHGETINPALKEAAERSLAKATKSIFHKATLHVKTTPAAAWVKINGTLVGRGNVTVDLAAETPYRVEGELTDHKTPDPVTITLVPKEDRTHTMTLEAITFYGTVELEIFPKDGVQVYVDTVQVGEAGKQPIQVAEGRRLLCFKKPGYDRWWRYLEIRRGQKTGLKVDLREKSRADEPCDVLPPLDQR